MTKVEVHGESRFSTIDWFWLLIDSRILKFYCFIYFANDWIKSKVNLINSIKEKKCAFFKNMFFLNQKRAKFAKIAFTHFRMVKNSIHNNTILSSLWICFECNLHFTFNKFKMSWKENYLSPISLHLRAKKLQMTKISDYRRKQLIQPFLNKNSKPTKPAKGTQTNDHCYCCCRMRPYQGIPCSTANREISIKITVWKWRRLKYSW